MNDLEIETRIAEIEGNTLVWSNNWGKYVIGTPYGKDEVAYEPLTDDALCFQLMVKYKVSLLQEENGYFDAYINAITTEMNAYNDDDNFFFDCNYGDPNHNKAILLAIIEAHKS